MRAVDRDRLDHWWRQPEAELFRTYIENAAQDAKNRVVRQDLDLSEARNVYEVARCQGECRLIRRIQDTKKLLDDLERLTEQT